VKPTARKLSGMQKVETPFAESKATDLLHQGAIHLLGFEFDGTACFRKGAVLGPNAMRDISFGIESYSPYLNLDSSEIDFYDLGNLPVDRGWEEGTNYFFKEFSHAELAINKIKLLTLGGEHSISYAPIKTYLEEYKDLVLLHLDAHADLRDGYEGHHYSHASIIRRVYDHFQKSHELIQYGIRSGTREEYSWMSQQKTLCESRGDFLKQVRGIDDERPIYLTLDLDYFDPSFFAGTGTPEPGGEDFHSFVSLMKILKNKNFVGADIVELAPNIDSSGNSAVFAAKVVRETILALNSESQKMVN